MKVNSSEFKVYYDEFTIIKREDGRWVYTHQYYTNVKGIADTLHKAKQAVDNYHDEWEVDYDYDSDRGDD